MNKTKDKIKKAAIQLLFVKGKFRSNSEDIADYAKINRPLIYYYFKNVDELIQTILKDTLDQRDQKILEILNREIKLSKKIDLLFDIHLKYTIKYPFRQIYIWTDKKNMAHNKDINYLNDLVIQRLKHLFDEEIKNNNLKLNSSIQAILLLSSYLNYPLLLISLGPRLLKFSKVEYTNQLKERKSTFINLIFKY